MLITVITLPYFEIGGDGGDCGSCAVYLKTQSGNSTVILKKDVGKLNAVKQKPFTRETVTLDFYADIQPQPYAMTKFERDTTNRRENISGFISELIANVPYYAE